MSERVFERTSHHHGFFPLTGAPCFRTSRARRMTCRCTSECRVRLLGRTVLITGGGRGIGRALVRFFADAGATTAVIEVDERALADVGHEHDVSLFAVDVSNPTDVDAQSSSSSRTPDGSTSSSTTLASFGIESSGSSPTATGTR